MRRATYAFALAFGLAFGACQDAGLLTTLEDPVDSGPGSLADTSTPDDLEDADTNADAGPVDVPDGGGPVDAARDTSTGPVTAFTGAPAYQAANGASARNAKHAFGGANPTNPAKQACFSCHKNGGPGPIFLFAGTVFKEEAGTNPAPGVEIRVRTNAGGARIVRSDGDGNFYLKPAAGDPATPWQAGARNATVVQLMKDNVTDGNCNGCHVGGGGTAFIHLP